VIPETRYAKTPDGVHLAYHVIGDGPIDVLCQDSPLSHHSTPPPPSVSGYGSIGRGRRGAQRREPG
jgi:hypothetical protein